MPITKTAYLRGRDVTYANEYSAEISNNIDKLLEAVNLFLEDYNAPLDVNSGWRPPTINAMTPNAAKSSKHILGSAIDVNDPNGSLFTYILQNLEKAADLNMYFEDARWTRTKSGGGWCHMQLGSPKSRKRIFIPSAALPIAPNFWTGKYDSKFDGVV